MLLFLLASLLSPPNSNPVEDLRAWLACSAESRPPLVDQPFAKTALTKEQAAEAGEVLWQDLVAEVKRTHEREWKDKRIKLGDLDMKFDHRVFGEKPARGRGLFISMHGGGSAPARVNDQQWQNQKRLYKPEEGVYLAPRAPNEAWSRWFQPHMTRFSSG